MVCSGGNFKAETRSTQGTYSENTVREYCDFVVDLFYKLIIKTAQKQQYHPNKRSR